MLRLDSDALSNAEIAPVAAAPRSVRKKSASESITLNLPVERGFPRWARIGENAVRAGDPVFFAGAGLALLDAILRENPPFVGALRQRLAVRAAAACVKMARLREDAAGLRDAEHLAPGAGTTQTSLAGRIHRLVGLTDATSFDVLAGALRDIVAGAEHPLAAAVGAGAAAMKLLTDAPPVDVEIFAFWLSDLALAQRLGWDAPVPLLATAIAHASLRRGPTGKRPHPGEPDWADAVAGAYANAAAEAYALAGELTRAGEKLLAAQPKLRAKSAGRVIELLLSDDAVSPARAAKAARLSDRAARRLFDRLIELGAVRELSGRPNFRFYGL
jgi:hypothetical protein